MKQILGVCLTVFAVIGLFSEPAMAVKIKRSQPAVKSTWSPADTPVTADTPARVASDTRSRVILDTQAMGISADTRSLSGDTVTDTTPQDTRTFSARAGGRFYHKRTFLHAPAPGAGVYLSPDTAPLKDSFAACPICFVPPITEEDFELEEAIGNQVAGIVEFRYRKSEDAKIAARLARIGQPMTKILDRNHLEFYFTPLRSTFEKNAISAGNGYIYFTTGLLDILEDDGEVGAVLAHEISHAEFRHVLQDFKLSQKLTLITAIASAVLNRTANIGGILQVLQDYAVHLVMNGFSRQFELEADAGAKWILESMGQDTGAMRRVLMKLDDLSRDRPERLTILQSHPEESERIKAFDETKVFNKTISGDTLSMKLKFQRPRLVGWFKERAVPALYASLFNETDSPIIVSDMLASYEAPDMPGVKVEIDPSKMVIPERSYGQLKILIIAKEELSRNPKSIDFSCSVSGLDQPVQRDPQSRKKIVERIAFHFDLIP